MNRNQLVFVNILLGFAAVTLLMLFLYLPVTVHVQYRTIKGSHTESYVTNAGDVREFASALKEKKDGTNIIVDTDKDHALTNKMTIRVRKGTFRSATVFGKEKKLCLYPGTVQENLKINHISCHKDDVVTPKMSSDVTDDTALDIKEVRYKTEQVHQTVKSENKILLDRTVASGTIREEEGCDGDALYRVKTTFVNGEVSKVERKFLKWVREPEDSKLTFGTSVTGEDGPVSYSRIFTGNTTAYYAGPSAHGATGQSCHYGTCAVDPSVIPYGTRLYVEGYGIAVANDCGGAVKGNVVDLYMNSLGECFRWGRRYVRVYVLEN